MRETSDGLVYDQPFGISSTAAFISTALQQLLGLPPATNGNAGDVTINTNRLTLRDGTLVNVSNFGSGNAGNLKINANNINLDNSNIGAATASGQGGNIFLQANSTINATSSDPDLISALAANSGSSVTGSANGGNIIIDTNLLIVIENSKITANAFKGRGGNININALGFFSSPDSKITASSEFGLNGNIQINALDNNSGINKAAPERIPTTPQITPACQKQVGTGTGSFAVSSRNLQSKPNDLIHNNIEQSNSFPISGLNNLYNPKSLRSNQPTQIIEANALIRDSQGNFVLTTDQANLALDDASLSASSCFSVFQ
jgi:large exoprotein involved in heme utilization and adhesion